MPPTYCLGSYCISVGFTQPDATLSIRYLAFHNPIGHSLVYVLACCEIVIHMMLFVQNKRKKMM
jgi:hypothetical protein